MAYSPQYCQTFQVSNLIVSFLFSQQLAGVCHRESIFNPAIIMLMAKTTPNLTREASVSIQFFLLDLGI